MRNRTLVGICIGGPLIAISLVLFYWAPVHETVAAQTLPTPMATPDAKLQVERDLSKEKLARVRQEAIDIAIAVRQMMEKDFRDWGLSQSRTINPTDQQGESGLRMYWKKDNTHFFLTVDLALDKDAALKFYQFGNSRISMGEGYSAPAIYGERAVIIKNVKVNSENKSVSLNFPNGRMVVRASVHNHQRSNTKNESDLLRMMEKIYPLLIAKENFDDV